MTANPTLLRAPRPCGSWSWWPDDQVAGPFEQAETAARLIAITVRHGLLEPTRIACAWEVNGRVVPRVSAAVEVDGGIDSANLVSRLTAARPAELPEIARIGELIITGNGTWLDESGDIHTEPRLLELTVELATEDPNVGVSVFHDVWMSHDFRGNPHPAIHAQNAPRLAETLAEISDVLGIEAEPDETKYFGHAVGLGVENSVDIDDVPLDVTDLIGK